MKLSPPMKIIPRMKTCPVRVHWVAVSRTVSPVSVTAETDVKRASMNAAEPGPRCMNGSIRSRVETPDSPRNPYVSTKGETSAWEGDLASETVSRRGVI